VPWVSFANVPNGKTVVLESTVRGFSERFFQAADRKLRCSNLFNDMHSGKSSSFIKTGDLWLRDHLGDHCRWAKDHNSLLIVTFDENDDSSDFAGLTDPRSTDHSIRNRIAMIFAGARVKAGQYPERNGITHVNILRTIEAIYGLPKSGAQQEHVVGGGISDDFIITDVFTTQQLRTNPPEGNRFLGMAFPLFTRGSCHKDEDCEPG
jgi:hypothetical protein